MTSCPTEEDLVLFVEGEAADGDGIAEHLTGCAACRGLVARSEAALRYALGGLADRERATPVRPPARRPPPKSLVRRPVWVTALGTVFAASSAVALVALVLFASQVADREVAGPRAGTSTVAPAGPATLDERLHGLLARVERMESPADDGGGSDVALAALAAAEARADLSMPTAVARLRDVVERFPGTPEAREARARIALLEGGR